MTDVVEVVVQEPIEEAAEEQAAPEGGSKGKAVVDADNTENGDKNVQDALEAKIAQMSAKKTEDKSGEKELSRLYKKATKDLKEQLDAIPSESEKVKLLERKFLEKVHQCNTADRKVDNLQRSLEVAQRDKDNLTNELSRTNAVKSKLETLCKELQKQNKNVLEQSKQISTDEQRKRQELSEKFSETIKDVQNKIANHDEERVKQDQENIKLREQLQSFINQYEVRDKHFEHQLKAKDLECQLAEAKLRQAEELSNKAIERADLYRQQALGLAEREVVLKEQINTYSEKFKELQETLTKSNEVFTSFKKDSDKMQKRIKASEKERLTAEKLAQKSIKELQEVNERHEALKKEAADNKKKKERMETLCRTLTQERADLKDKLRALGALPGPDLGTPGIDAAPEAEAADLTADTAASDHQ